MSVLARELNNLLNNNTYVPYSNSFGSSVYKTTSNDNEYVVEIPLVGVSRDNVTVDVQDNVLSVVANAKNSYYARDFKQSWNLNKDSDVDNVTANLENGLLTVRVPRFKPVKKTVSVTVN